MRPQLKYWTNLTKEEKQKIMQEKNIKVVTFKDIEKIYFEKFLK